VNLQASAIDLPNGMFSFPISYVGHRVQLNYNYTYQDPTTGNVDNGTAAAEDSYVPGLGPERLVPMDGIGSESQPSISPEFYYAGYPAGITNGTQALGQILAERFWLAWVSTRDLYKPNATQGNPPTKGKAGTHVFYGAFLPDFSPPAEAP